MKNKVYKGILGIITSLTVALSLSACSTSSTANTSGTGVGTSTSLNQNILVKSNIPTPQTRVS